PERMNEQRRVRVSKYLSRHLRHRPERIGLTLDEGGWAEIDTLIAAAAAHGFRFTREELAHVVAADDKRRFAVEGARIRARQGHRSEGLRPMNRHDVHLSADRETATRVGARRGRPVVLTVDAGALHADGHVFRVSANGVWLTASVPSRYLRFPPDTSDTA